MNPQLRQHGRSYFLLLGLLVGALFVGFNSAQATQLRTTSPGVLAAATPNPAWTCTVVIATGLNLRTGPGTNYSIITLLKGTKTQPVKVRPLAASPDRKWIQAIKIGGSNPPTGWVSASPVNIACTMPLSQLAVGVVPPTPTPASVPPTPTPDSISYSPAPNGGGADNGVVLIDRAAIVRGSSEAVFRDRLAIQLDVRPRDASRGAAIRSVEFTIENNDTGDEYYFHRENGAPYCLFANQGNTCNTIWNFRQTALWPKSDRPVADGWDRRIDPNTVYRAKIRAVSEDGTNADWDFTFRMIPTGTPSHAVYSVPSFDLWFTNPDIDYNGEVRVQYDSVIDNSSGTIILGDHMVFQLTVSDRFGGPDGEGIGEVQFEIVDRNSGELVYQHTERNDPYCVFGNDQSYCDTIWRFADTGYQWPSSDDSSIEPQRLQPGNEYQAIMTVRDTNGDEVGSGNFIFQVQ